MATPLLGVDEGTTGVKAALFDTDLRPIREARRDKVNRHPKPGWVEQDGEEVLTVVVEAIAEVLEDAPERWSRSASTTRASRSLPGMPRAARRYRRSSCGRTSARRRSSTG